MSLSKAFHAVRAFHRAFNHPAPDYPTVQPTDRAAKRGKWINEEVGELVEASTRELTPEYTEIDKITDQADAYLDQIYFGLGGLVELGVNPSPLFDIINDANMAKLHRIDGELVAVYHPDGKVKKPAGWTAPEPLLRAEVERQIRAAKANAE